MPMTPSPSIEPKMHQTFGFSVLHNQNLKPLLKRAFLALPLHTPFQIDTKIRSDSPFPTNSPTPPPNLQRFTLPARCFHTSNETDQLIEECRISRESTLAAHLQFQPDWWLTNLFCTAGANLNQFTFWNKTSGNHWNTKWQTKNVVHI